MKDDFPEVHKFAINMADCQDIVTTIQAMIDDYYADSNQNPQGIILGPLEYVKLCYHLTSQAYPSANERNDNEMIWATKFYGVPIRVKELSGYDIEIDPQDALNILAENNLNESQPRK